jgi:hypothetical protein
MITISFDLDSAGRPVIDLFAGPSDPERELLRAAGESPPRPVAIRALVDTGASRSIVQRANLEGLDLDQLGTEWLTTVSSGSTPSEARVFAVQLFFAGVTGGVLAPNLRVVEVENLSGFGVDMLLGRDVLDQCLLVYTGQQRQFTLAFGQQSPLP